MKNWIRTTLAVLSVLTGTALQAQTLQPSYGAPSTPISVCDGNGLFKIKINGSSSPCASATVAITLPTGYVYVAGSATLMHGSGSVSESNVATNTATLNFTSIPASPDSVVVSYQAFATCGAIGTSTTTNVQANYNLNSCLMGYQVTSNSFSTQSAALNISSVTNQNYAGSVGDVYNRAISITNNGLGTVSQLTFKDTSGNGFYISNPQVSAGWTISSTKTVYGIDTISTFLLTGPSLSKGQTVVVTETVKLTNQCYLQSNFNAYFGCSGNACTTNNVSASSSAGASVNGSLSPVLKVIPMQTALICRGVSYAEGVAFANTGTAPLYNLSLNIFSSTWSAGPATNYFNKNVSYLSGYQSGFSNYQYKKGAAGTLMPVTFDSTKSFTNPGSSISGLASSVYLTLPIINPGDTIYVSYNELNSPITGLSQGNTMAVAGNLLRYTYLDGCGTSTSPTAQFLRPSQDTRMNTQATIPANMEPGQSYSFSYYFSEAHSGVYIYSGADPSTIRFDLKLPNRIAFTGSASDITLTRNGTSIGTPTGFSYSASSHILSITYPVSTTFNVGSLQGGTLTFSALGLDCSQADNGNTATLNCYLKTMSSCSNTEWFSSLSNQPGLICPLSCGTQGGMSFNGYKLERTNFGLPDNDNNGVADNSGTIDLTKVRKDYAMMGDTISASFYGRISVGSTSPATGFHYGYATDTFSNYYANIANLYATVQLFSSGSSTPFYSYNNLPVSGALGKTRTVDFSIPTLNSLSPLPAGYLSYNDGDSVVVKVYYAVKANPFGTITAVSVGNKFLISGSANPSPAQQYSCGGAYTGNMSIVGWGAGSTTGTNLTYNSSGSTPVATQAINAAYMGPCCVTSGSKPFVYEYRSVTIYDSMAYTMPAGYDFVSASVTYNYTTGPNTAGTKTVSIVPVNPSASTLVFNLQSLFENGSLPYGDQGSRLVGTVTIKPNCSAGSNAIARIFIRQISTPGNNTGFLYTVSFADTIYHTAAKLTASAANASVTASTNTATWEVQVANSSATATATSVWIAKDTAASGLSIVSVQKLSGAGGSVVNVITPSAGGIYQLGDFGQTNVYYRINATYSSCGKDSMRVAYGYVCDNSGYPASVVSASNKTDLTLSVTTLQPSMQTKIISQPVGASHNFCDTLSYELETTNGGSNSALQLSVAVALPTSGGVSYVAGSFQVQYPAGSGTYVTIDDNNVNQTSGQIEFTIPATLVAQLGITQSFRTRFGLQTSCGFETGESFRFNSFGTAPCGARTSGIPQQGQKINITGAPAYTNLYSINSSADTAVKNCIAAGDLIANYRFKIVNQGPLPTTASDGFTITTPLPWILDTTTIKFIHNPNGAKFRSYSGGVFHFDSGVGLIVGDSVVFTAKLRVPGADVSSLSNGNSPVIKEQGVVRYIGFCSSTGLPCPMSEVPVPTANATSSVYYNKNTVKEIALPTLFIHNPAAVCSPGTINLTDSAITVGSTPGLTYSYFTDSTNIHHVAAPSSVKDSGTYYISGMAASGCVTKTRPVEALINAGTALQAGPADTLVCKSTPVTLKASAVNATIQWINYGAGPAITVTPDTATTYYAVATNQSSGCTDTAIAHISVVNFTGSLSSNPSEIVAGNQVTLTTTASSGYKVTAWMPSGLFGSSLAKTQSFTVAKSDSVFSAVVKSAEGCVDTARLSITVLGNVGDFFVPNAFSPNGDGQNEVFKVYSTAVKTIDLKVLNQWGQLLFESRDQNRGWDGMYKGQPQPQGVYVYIVVATLQNGTEIKKVKSFVLVR